MSETPLLYYRTKEQTGSATLHLKRRYTHMM